MSFLKHFGFASEQHVADTLASIESHQVNGRLRGKLAQLKKKQTGFTLLELLVVVAIIAAIAGTSTILLRDTDRQAAAAAHVAMMDELMKGISTYQVLNGGMFPDNFDSLMASADGTLTTPAVAAVVNEDLALSLSATALSDEEIALLSDFGVQNVQVIDQAGVPTDYTGAYSCADDEIKDLINDKSSDVTAATIFRSVDANGCGASAAIPATAATLMAWNEDAGSFERVNADFSKAATQTLVALGIGPSSDLFLVEKRGAMTTVPTYRHVSADEYNRFVALLNVDTAVSEVRLQAIIDGAGDTKDEELGEWDGTRPTI